MTALASLPGVAGAAIPALLSHLWSSTLFLALLLVVAFGARKRLRAGARFTLAFIGIVKFALPAGAVATAARVLGLDRPGATPGDGFALPLQILAGPVTFEAAAAEPAAWPAVAGAVWLAVAVALLLRSTLARHRLVSLAVRTAMPPSAREVAALGRARRRVGIRRSIDVARSAMPETPAVLRTFRPLVVLPAAGCDDLSDDELESLLRHECAHVARHDNVMASIESSICALFWFHPLLWLAQRVTVLERERACDEVAARTPDERDAYLTALTKFCHAAIAPRLPGVSCMSTARLKERMDHVMKYAGSEKQALSGRRIALVAIPALAIFTLVCGLPGGRALAGEAAGTVPPHATDASYAIRVAAARTGETIELSGSISDNRTARVIAAPQLVFAVGEPARFESSGSGWEVSFDVLPGSADSLPIEVVIRKDGSVVQENTLTTAVRDAEAVAVAGRFTGEPISLTLRDADLKAVVDTFGQITGLDIRLDPAVKGKVTVDWHNVPWDQALDSLLAEQALTYRTEGSILHVTRK